MIFGRKTIIQIEQLPYRKKIFFEFLNIHKHWKWIIKYSLTLEEHNSVLWGYGKLNPWLRTRIIKVQIQW